jgi:hypothetical protein
MVQDAGRCTKFSHKVIHSNCGETGDPFLRQRLTWVYVNCLQVFRLTP